MTSEPIVFKILLIGESSTGKTELLKRFITKKPIKNHLATIGINFQTKLLNIDNQEIKIKIWDTDGQERFKNITTQYYKGADGIVFVFDVTNKYSYETMRKWILDIVNKEEELNFVLFGNKCDFEYREVTEEMGKKLGEEFKINYFETSYITGQGIEEGFESLSRDIMKRKGIEKGNIDINKIKLNNEKKQKLNKQRNCHN